MWFIFFYGFITGLSAPFVLGGVLYLIEERKQRNG